MLFLTHALVLATCLGYTSGSTIVSVEKRVIESRAVVNGSCISGPDSSCVSFVGLCVTSIVTGKVSVGSTSFWSDNVCTAAATCAGMGSVLNAACCAGTCRKPLDIASLDYNNVYAKIVGSCASQSGGCSMTWQPFVDWFYNTIQGTGTNIWPDSGDYVLDWWAKIATWTGFCEGNDCADSAIPYSNFNDWFHYSAAVVVTTPGTPEYEPPLSANGSENVDLWTPNFYWPCPFEDLNDCWWDYGPPTDATSLTDNGLLQAQVVEGGVRMQPRSRNQPLKLAMFGAETKNADTLFPFGRGENQPDNVPPPVYVNGQLVPLRLNGTAVTWDTEQLSKIVPLDRASLDPTPTLNEPTPASSASSVLAKRATPTITAAACNGGRSPIETPAVRPTLTYFCNYLPNICANIRSHGDWDHTTDSMVLTYDPFSTNSNRRDVCTEDVKTIFQLSGRCDPNEHNPVDWHVSCDEFPFNSSLEGGEGNAIVQRVPTREQQYQGTLQTSLIHLRRIKSDKATSWNGKSNRMCHQYLLKLVDNVPAGAEAGSIGSLDPGSAFLATTNGIRWLKDKRLTNNKYPRSFSSTSWAYATTDTALGVPGWKSVTFDCAPTSTSACTTTTNVPRALATPTQIAGRIVPAARAANSKRDAPACTISSQPPLPTTSADASALAAASADTAKAAAAAAAAALASASNPTADEAAIAVAAVAAANDLVPAAAALASAASDSAIATSVAAAQTAYDAAQDSLSSILSLGPDIPDWLHQIWDSVSSSSSAVEKSIASQSNVMNPQTRVPPDTNPPNNPNVNSGPPASVPPAACFPAGSKGFVKIGDSYLINQNGKAPATLVGVGSSSYFGMTIPTNVEVQVVDGCQGVYTWNFAASGLQPDFQVDCSTNELGSYWNGQKLPCYAYPISASQFHVLCGTNVGNIYSCLQNGGLYGQLSPAFFTWATS
ncbi:hypothetical protein ONZ51_g1160 [Trametes cubensis]|uniref:Deoxyribonuclease NucA/NucB domain-containing protein n=1 Tax=Trametes cubensis TaxID=1111947 RepID=A0AAD7U277_9APHY|nr:hypothetical protein ONZ51_g1160 [Trametes cubensis]